MWGCKRGEGGIGSEEIKRRQGRERRGRQMKRGRDWWGIGVERE